MSVCPWCRAESVEASAPCPQCGRTAVEQAGPRRRPKSSPAQAPAATPDLDFGARVPKAPAPPSGVSYALNDTGVYDPGQPAAVEVLPPGGAPRVSNSRPAPAEVASNVPSLVPPSLAPPAPAAPRAVAQAPAPAAPQPGAGSGLKRSNPPKMVPGFGGSSGMLLEDDESHEGNISLELDIAKASVPPKAPSQAPMPMQGQPRTASIPVPVGVPVSHHPPPGSPDAQRVDVEREIQRQQAEALGAYGEVPKHFWETPMYAYRVYMRQNELKRELVARKNEAQQAVTQLEDALVAFAERVRPAAEAMPFYIRTFDPIRGLENQIRSMDGVASQEMDQHRARMREIDVRCTQAEQVLSQLQLEERRIADDLAQAESALGRAEAKLKRAELEMRQAQALPPGPPRRP